MASQHPINGVGNDNGDADDGSKASAAAKAKPPQVPAADCSKADGSSNLGVTHEQRGNETGGEGERREDGTGGVARTVFSLADGDGGDGDDDDDDDDDDDGHPADVHVDVDVVADELLELEIDIPVEEEKKALPSTLSASPKPLLPPGSCSPSPPAAAKPGRPVRLFHSHQSQGGGGGGSSGGSAAGGVGDGDVDVDVDLNEDGEGCALTRTTSGSEASCFGVERGGGEGSSHDAFDEGEKYKISRLSQVLTVALRTRVDQATAATTATTITTMTPTATEVAQRRTAATAMTAAAARNKKRQKNPAALHVWYFLLVQFPLKMRHATLLTTCPSNARLTFPFCPPCSVVLVDSVRAVLAGRVRSFSRERLAATV